MGNKNVIEFIETVKANPELPVIALVNNEVVADVDYSYWIGEFGRTAIKEVYYGNSSVHFRDGDQEEVLADLVGCEYYCTPEGKDITELSDEEWNDLFNSLPWEKHIVLYIES